MIMRFIRIDLNTGSHLIKQFFEIEEKQLWLIPPVANASCVVQACQILADQLTLFQPGGTDYAHLITTGKTGFSDLPTALNFKSFVKSHRFKK